MQAKLQDLSQWLEALQKLNSLLEELRLLMLQNLNTTSVAKRGICVILKFLSVLLKCSKDKRYFINFEVSSDSMRIICPIG